MGVGRASLYSTFGDKEELFIKAIRRYHARLAELWELLIAEEEEEEEEV